GTAAIETTWTGQCQKRRPLRNLTSPLRHLNRADENASRDARQIRDRGRAIATNRLGARAADVVSSGTVSVRVSPFTSTPIESTCSTSALSFPPLVVGIVKIPM